MTTLNNVTYLLSFAVDNKLVLEIIGIVASAFILVSFLMSDERKIRLINIVGAVIFVVYGLLLPSYATAVMNAALVVVHIIKLIKIKRSKQQDTRQQPSEQTEDVTQ